jgi:branched-chain amino acid transport system ATP-binding protein
MLDEPSLGLVPKLVGVIFEKILEINRTRGLTILLVKQNANLALEISQRTYVLETGRMVMEGDSKKLRTQPQLKAAYWGGT